MDKFTPSFCCLSLVLICLLFQACTNNSKAELEKLSWLTGWWENKIEGRHTFEIWERQNEESYLVKGVMLEGQDTIFSENIHVALQNQKIEYQVTISDQNNGKAVAFALTENNGNKAVFTNLKHNFPKKISYTRQGHKEVLIQLEGTLKGKPVRERYSLFKQAPAIL